MIHNGENILIRKTTHLPKNLMYFMILFDRINKGGKTPT
jgi:hypothetical protein